MNAIRVWSLRGTLVVVAATAVTLLLGGASAQAGGCREPVSSGTTTTVVLDGVCFSPTVVRIAPGDTVTWRNDVSKMAHTVTGANLSFGSLEEIGPGASVSYEFLSEGVYPYYCLLHPGMAGTVVAGDDALSTANAESVSLAGGAQSDGVPGLTSNGGGGVGPVWQIALALGVTAATTAVGGFVVGTRRARHSVRRS